MQTTTLHSVQARQSATASHAGYLPLEFETRPTVETAAAAFFLNRRPQTLRGWAMKDGTGPIRPIRIHGRLAWKTADLKQLLGVA